MKLKEYFIWCMILSFQEVRLAEPTSNLSALHLVLTFQASISVVNRGKFPFFFLRPSQSEQTGKPLTNRGFSRHSEFPYFVYREGFC